MGAGRISLLIESPLRDLLLLMRSVPGEADKQARARAQRAAEPVWFEETRGRGDTRIQQRVLVNSARVGVTGRNIFLRSGGVGRLSSGTPVSRIADAAEFGLTPSKLIATRSRKGTPYKRRAGNAFGAPRRGGNVFWPAVKDASARVTSVIIQTYRRTLFDALDGKK